MKVIVLVLAGLLISCGKSSNPPAIKSVFSSWHMTGCTNGGIIDFTKGVLDVNFTSTYTYIGGEKCSCTAKLSSTQYDSYTLSGCAYVASTGSGTDPAGFPCSTWNDSGSYSIGADNVLHIYSPHMATSNSICLTFE